MVTTPTTAGLRAPHGRRRQQLSSSVADNDEGKQAFKVNGRDAVSGADEEETRRLANRFGRTVLALRGEAA
jgi:hypothetical protein